MSEASRKKVQPWKALLGILLLAGAGAFVGYLLARFGLALPGVHTRLSNLGRWDLLALPVLYLSAIAVHEGGHVLGGISRGMRFLLLIVGPFKLSRSADNRVHFGWVFNLGTLGGVAACSPDMQRPLLPQMQGLVVGGPLASVLLVLLGLAIAGFDDGRLGAYALILAAISLLIFGVTALPMRAGGFMSDGMQWLELRRGGVAVQQRSLFATLMGQSLSGMRPAELDRELIERLLAVDDEMIRRIAARWYAFVQSWDAGDLTRAESHAEWISEHVDDYPDGFRQGLTIELATFAGLVKNDLSTCRSWLQRSRGGVVDVSRRALAEASVALLEGRTLDASQRLDVAQRKLGSGLDSGLCKFTETQIAQMRSKLGEVSQSSLTSATVTFPTAARL